MPAADANQPPMLRLVNTDDAPTRRALPQRNPLQHLISRAETRRATAHAAPRRTTPQGERRRPAHQTAAETAASATAQPLPRTSPSWAFAARVASQIEGGRAGVLRPERRERLLRLAQNLGIRPFDAALIIAMVQDAARRGETAPGHAPLSPQLADRLADRLPATTANAAPPRLAVSILQRLLGATIIAAAMVTAAILWLQSAP